MFYVCLPGPSWGLHMDYTPGILCPAWTPCTLAAGTQPSQITRLLSWKWQTHKQGERQKKKNQCHTQTSVFSWDDIWLALLLTEIFTQWLVIVLTAIQQRRKSAMQTSFQHLKQQRLCCNLTENTKLYLNLLHTNRGAEQVLTLLLFGTYAWKLNLFPWQWQNPMACSAASVAMTTAH